MVHLIQKKLSIHAKAKPNTLVVAFRGPVDCYCCSSNTSIASKQKVHRQHLSYSPRTMATLRFGDCGNVSHLTDGGKEAKMFVSNHRKVYENQRAVRQDRQFQNDEIWI
mmetsp:Transcript_1046/g.2366  ORF Transcript_1046/g.2366 Transcript_1046/m.2366 type:complete len:109 (+) Transcript_1046:730-1056(+)